MCGLLSGLLLNLVSGTLEIALCLSSRIVKAWEVFDCVCLCRLQRGFCLRI